ncbi:MAG TPA: GNAT family N-acetyltransferase [Methanomicrobiales archaeon]|nr:GNAT family N-acetyltransferase [Methanomicrobiales archaeon]
MGARIALATESDAGEWDDLNANSPDGTVFHRWKWLRIAEKYAGGARLFPLVSTEGEEMTGIFPVFLRTVPLMRLLFSPPPRLAIRFLGPVLGAGTRQKSSRREQNRMEMQRVAMEYITTALRPDYSLIAHSPSMIDVRTFRWMGYTNDTMFDYIADIREGPDQLWKDLRGTQRTDLRKALKIGMSIRTGGVQELRAIYDLLVQRYREQGKSVNVPEPYLTELLREFPESIKVFAVEYGGRIVTGSIELELTRDEMTSWIGNPKPSQAISPSPNELLNWETLKDAAARGYTWYSILGAAGNQRLSRYYSAKIPNLDLRTRYVSRKAGFLGSCAMRGYMGIVKPLSERIGSLV